MLLLLLFKTKQSSTAGLGQARQSHICILCCSLSVLTSLTSFAMKPDYHFVGLEFICFSTQSIEVHCSNEISHSLIALPLQEKVLCNVRYVNSGLKYIPWWSLKQPLSVYGICISRRFVKETGFYSQKSGFYFLTHCSVYIFLGHTHSPRVCEINAAGLLLA